MNANAQSSAVAAQSKASADNIALAKDIFSQQKDEVAPWQQAGAQALSTLQSKIASGAFDMSKYGYSDLIQDPGYQFRLQQGQDALDAQGAKAGNYFSGNQLEAASNYNQQAASQEFSNAYARTAANQQQQFNMLSDLSQTGENAAGALSGAAGTMGTNIATANTNAANAAATGAVNTGNAYSSAINGIATSANQGMENYLLYNQLKAA